MQILNIILNIMAIIANCFLTWFAVSAWFELRRMKRDFAGVKRAMVVTTTITVANHVKDSFEQLNDMKETFNQLVEDEQYEEAERLKAAITDAERNAKAATKLFKDICGDSCDVVVTKVKKHCSEED